MPDYSSYKRTSLEILYDEERLVNEFIKLPVKLQEILWYASAYSKLRFNVQLVLTHIFRTQEEQDAIYKNDAKYKQKKYTSVHQLYRGADARLHDMGVENAKKLADHINSLFKYSPDSKLNTVLVHDVGQGNHIHFQISS